MCKVGVKIENEEEVADLIFDHTGGHPNLVQYLCEKCLKEISKKKIRVLTKETVQNQCQRSTFREKCMETFWSQATQLEKALSVLVAKHGRIDDKEALKELQKNGFECSINQLKRGFRYLELCQFLVSTDDYYTLKPPRLRNYIDVFTIDQWMKDFLKEEKSN
jgi:hypothetical protein